MNFEEIEAKIKKKETINSDEISFFLQQIIRRIYQMIPSKTLENTCDLIQSLIGNYLNELGVTFHACQTDHVIDPYVVGHSFLIADLKDCSQELYLIDPSFLQFYLVKDKYQDFYLYEMKVMTKSPYEYAIADFEKTDFLMKNGYIPFDVEVAAWYGNSFYQTKVGIKKGDFLSYIPGSVFYKLFLKENEKLQAYENSLFSSSKH